MRLRQYMALRPGTVLQPVTEDSPGYIAKMGGGEVASQRRQDPTRHRVQDQTWDDQIKKIKNGLRMNENKIALAGPRRRS